LIKAYLLEWNISRDYKLMLESAKPYRVLWYMKGYIN